jgi:glycosyltransferase involved in cell wall biosynthesis
VISQVYVPDPASVGQHLADASEAMVARGYRVVVLTSARGYESPRVKFPRREQRGGVEIVRLPFSSFGKKTLAHRMVGQTLFLLQVIVRGLFFPRVRAILVSTSPPMASFAALVTSYIRRVTITYWLMDLNPDQMLALGKASRRSPLVWAMKWLNRRIFRRAAEVVVLDRYMAARIERQYEVRGGLTVLPPWPHDEAAAEVPSEDNPFRTEHNPDGRFVVMYSGNHSLASPVTTLLQAALKMRDDRRVRFMFVGGGLGKREVDEAITVHRPTNIVSLPYQPLEHLKYSLATADLHVVTLGTEMVGIIHPCKIYGAMAVGRPLLLVGPRPSHAADLIEQYDVGWHVDHGDVDGVVSAIHRAAEMTAESRSAYGERARAATKNAYGKNRLCAAFCDTVEGAMRGSQFALAGIDRGAHVDSSATLEPRRARGAAGVPADV